MSATITVRARPDYGPDVREAVIDCEHGTTTATLQTAPGGAQLTDRQIARAAVLKHEAVEHCRCIRRLQRRFGLL